MVQQDFLNPPPGVRCVEALSDTIFATAVQCTAASGYSFWVIRAPPTPTQVTSICQTTKCTQLVRNMQTVAPAECVMSDGFYLYGDILNPILQVCPTGIPSGGDGRTSTGAGGGINNNGGGGGGSSGGSSTTTVVVVIVVCLAAVGAAFLYFRHRRRQRQNVGTFARANEDYEAHSAYELSPLDRSPAYSLETPPGVKSHKAPPVSSRWSSASTAETSVSTAVSRPSTTVGYSGPKPLNAASFPLLSDPQVLRAKLDVDELTLGDFIDSGAYGSVFKGVYRGSPVAIKKLRAGAASEIATVTKFLEEIKLLASLSHPRIVTFIGVTWTKPEDVCAILEFMDGGHLLSLLRKFDADPHTPMGFDEVKLKIALDVAEALAYLHARSPPVIHRDLKSNNILLTKQYNAKLTDFGISREQVNEKMTMKIGTERWMAPEIINGQEYDTRADVFSFGVVLSELDTNKIPYATHQIGDMTSLAIMQAIARGNLTVEFSYASDPRMVALGRECVSLDPKERPTMEDVRRRIDAMLY